MARSSGALTEVPSSGDSEAPFGRKKDGTPRQRATYEGPRNPKPIRFVFTTVDAEGNEIPNAKINVLYSGKDADEAYTLKEQNPGASIQRVELKKNKEGEVE
jgi:hypothetical protein